MLAQSENLVRIEGILSEINLEESSFNKNGQNVPCIRGTVDIKVNYTYKDKKYDVVVPVSVFASKYTNAGKENPAYTAARYVLTDYTSIAATNEEEADRIRIPNASIAENSFYSGGSLISGIRINGSFFNRVKREEFEPSATFTATIVIANMTDEVDSDGVETGNLIIQGILVQYGERADVVKFIVIDPSAVAYIKSHWNIKDTVKINGVINYSSKTEYIEEEVGFGEPMRFPRTITVRELIITSGSPHGLDSEFTYDEEELSKALAARKNRLEQQKLASANNGGTRKAGNSIASSLSNIDF